MSNAGQSQVEKLRVRAMDAKGSPLASVRVELIAGASDKSGGTAQALRELHTSADGFAIFSLQNLSATGQLRGAAIRFGGSDAHVFPLDTALLTASRYESYSLTDVATEVRPGVPFAWTDDGIDADDVWAIPGIFPDLGDLKFGDDYCGRLVPKDQTVRIFERDHVVRTGKNVLAGVDYNMDVYVQMLLQNLNRGAGTPPPVQGQGEGGVLQGITAGGKGTPILPGDGRGPPMVAPVMAGEGKGTAGSGSDHFEGRYIWLHEGKLLHCELKWTHLGYTFGDLLYSLPLAPCESVTLAVSSWQRLQQAQATQSAASDQGQSASYSDSGMTSDALSALSTSTQQTSAHGWALGASVSASGGDPTDLFGKATAALGVGYSSTKTNSADTHQLATNATHNFSDSVQQSAEGWRRDHQAVVMEQSDTQNQAISYRTVCNNNHCHVLNIFYHEVLTNFRACSRFMGSRDVYFVPYDVRNFDSDLAVCGRPFLLPFLLDKSLVDCYDDSTWAASQASSLPGADNLSRLLKHLNCNALYYNSLLWLFEDPNERIYRFDKIVFGADCLTDLIDPVPLAVMGNYVAFAKADSPYAPWTGDAVMDESLVTLPTAGIFADAALGKCTTCETPDPNVYWDWKDTPCNCAGKDVTLAQPATNSLFPASGPFLSYPTQILTNATAPAAGMATNSLVAAFGSALATAMFAGNDSVNQLTALQTILGQMTTMLKGTPDKPDTTGDAKPDPNAAKKT